MLRFVPLTQHNQQPSVLLFSPLYTRTYIHEGGFRHSDSDGTETVRRRVRQTYVLGIDNGGIFVGRKKPQERVQLSIIRDICKGAPIQNGKIY